MDGGQQQLASFESPVECDLLHDGDSGRDKTTTPHAHRQSRIPHTGSNDGSEKVQYRCRSGKENKSLSINQMSSLPVQRPAWSVRWDVGTSIA